MTACEKGEACELDFAAAARKQGFRVFLPVGHSGGADMVVMRDGERPVSVQVKMSQLDRCYKRYKASLRRRGSEEKCYTNGAFDVLALGVSDHGFVFYTIHQVSGSKGITWYPDRSSSQPWNWDVFDRIVDGTSCEDSKERLRPNIDYSARVGAG